MAARRWFGLRDGLVDDNAAAVEEVLVGLAAYEGRKRVFDGTEPCPFSPGVRPVARLHRYNQPPDAGEGRSVYLLADSIYIVSPHQHKMKSITRFHPQRLRFVVANLWTILRYPPLPPKETVDVFCLHRHLCLGVCE